VSVEEEDGEGGAFAFEAWDRGVVSERFF